MLRLINLSNLSNNAGGAGPGHTGGELWTSPVIDGTVNSAGHPAGTVSNAIGGLDQPRSRQLDVGIRTASAPAASAYKLVLTNGDPSLAALQWSSPNANYPGSAILLANNVLYRAYTTTSGTPGAGMIEARNPVTNALLWSNNTGIGSIHWQTPVVANGIVYFGRQRRQRHGFCVLPDAAGAPLSRTGWTATVGPNTTADPPANMLDGAIATRWSTGTAQANNGKSMAALSDMQANRTFNEVVLDANGTSDYPHGYTLSISTDGTNFTNVTSGASTTPLTTITFGTQTARYIKVLQTGAATSWWSVHELNVYSPSGALAAYPRTGWVASSDAYTSGADAPARVLDGTTTTRWSDGIPQSTTPLPSPAPYLQVDMTVAQPFSQITLDSTGSSGDYLRGYQVLAGNVQIRRPRCWPTAPPPPPSPPSRCRAPPLVTCAFSKPRPPAASVAGGRSRSSTSGIEAHGRARGLNRDEVASGAEPR